MSSFFRLQTKKLPIFIVQDSRDLVLMILPSVYYEQRILIICSLTNGTAVGALAIKLLFLRCVVYIVIGGGFDFFTTKTYTPIFLESDCFIAFSPHKRTLLRCFSF